MARGTGFAMQENRDFGIAEAHFLDEAAQLLQRLACILVAAGEFLIVNRQHKRRSARLLLGERGQVAIIGDAEHFYAFLLDGVGKCADAEPRGVFGAKIFVNDDNGKAEAHGLLQREALTRMPSIRMHLTGILFKKEQNPRQSSRELMRHPG